MGGMAKWRSAVLEGKLRKGYKKQKITIELVFTLSCHLGASALCRDMVLKKTKPACLHFTEVQSEEGGE